MILWATLVLTYRPFADGLDHSGYLLSSTALAWVPSLGYALTRLRLPYGHPVTLFAAAIIALGGSAPHWLRLAAAVEASAPRLEASAQFDGSDLPEGWQSDVAAGGRVFVSDGTLHAWTSAGSVAHAYTTLHLPEPPPPRPWRPAGFAAHPRVQVLEWSARVDMDGRFFVVADLERLLLQTVPHGVHITYWPPVGEGYGTEVKHTVAQDQLWHRWSVVRDEERVEIRLDDQTVWSAQAGPPFRLIRLGESRTDELHGGRLEVDWFRYRVHLAGEYTRRLEPHAVETQAVS